METTPTLSGAISSKLAEAIDGHTTGEILRFLGLVFMAGLISAVLLDGDILVRLLLWKHSAIPTVLTVYGVVFKWKSLVRFWKGVMPVHVPVTGEVIEGIPTDELLDWLFRHESLKIKEATQAFGVPQKRFEELVRHLKRVDILIAGPNNSSVLNPSFSRQDVASMVRGKEKASELETLFRKTELGYTSEPSNEEISFRLSDVNFTSRPLSA